MGSDSILDPVKESDSTKPKLRPFLKKPIKLKIGQVYRCKRKHVAGATDIFSNKEYKVSMNIKTGKLIYE